MNKFYKIAFYLLIALGIFLRLFSLDKFPPSLYWEEAALGYDAYSILETGKDFHGDSFPLTAFKSFGDYKPSAYFYATALSEKIFGLSEIAVRLPSALAGIAISLATYLIVQQLFANHKQRQTIAKLSLLVTLFSPWSFQFSRAGFEANLANTFSAFAIWLLLKSRKKITYLYGSVILFALSLYTYHSARVFIPLFLAAFILLNFSKIKKQLKHWVLAGLLGLFLTWPLISQLKAPEVAHRFQETSAFTDISIIKDINQKRADHDNSILSRVIYHRYWAYSKIVFDNVLDHFDPNYLFLSGDPNPRHSTRESGIFYPLDLIFLGLGLSLILLKRKSLIILLPLWWLLAIIPAAITKTTPHALRTLMAIPAPQIIIAYGLSHFFTQIKKHRSLIIVITVSIYLVLTARHFYYYFNTYPKLHSASWQYGYQELMEYLKINQNKYQTIYITRELGRPSIYYFFYNQIDPRLVQEQEASSKKDQGERLEFNQIKFYLPIINQETPSSLVVDTPQNTSDQDIIHIVTDLLGKPVFSLYEIN